MAKRSGSSFKECLADYASIYSDIKARKFAKIYLLMGEEAYFIDRLSSVMATDILSEQDREFNLTVVYGRDVTGGQVSELSRAYPMMASHNVVIVKQAQDMKEIEPLVNYCGNTAMMPPSTILVLCYVGKSVDKRSQLYKRIKDFGRIFESMRPRDYEISSWIGDMFRSKGLSIGEKAVAMLVENMGTDLTKINNETDKLITSLGVGVKEVTPADIEANIGISKDFNSFELTKALSQGNGAKAIMVVDYFEKTRNSDNIYGAFSLLFIHYQRIFMLGMMLWDAKRKGLSAPSDADVMRQLKLSSPIFVREYQAALARYNTQKAFAALGLIRRYDMKVKGIEAGSASAAESLKELILKLLTL